MKFKVGDKVGGKIEETRWFDDYMLEPATRPVKPQEIHITTDGLTTHAVLKEGGKVVKRAKATCNEKDTYDFGIGAELAMERLFAKDYRWYPNTPAVKEVKRRAKEGEWIKFVNAQYAFGYTNGDIRRVAKSTKHHTYISGLLNPFMCVWEEEYVVLENYQPPKGKEDKA